MRQSNRSIGFIFILLLLFIFIGCATGLNKMPSRFYTGQLKSRNEVAVITSAIMDCHILGIVDKENKKTVFNIRETPNFFELLPGDYTVIAAYIAYDKGIIIKQGDSVSFNLKAEAGKVYVIYPEFYEKKWRPISVNIDDYDKETYKKCNSGCSRAIYSGNYRYDVSCRTKKQIDKSVNNYFTKNIRPSYFEVTSAAK